MSAASTSVEPIDYRTCRQGAWDDCWLLAALVGLAFKRPDDLRNMIRANDDGSYTVTFPRRAPVVVRSEEGASTSEGAWAPVIEAAAGKYLTVTRPRVLTFGMGVRLLTGCRTKWSSNVSKIGFGPIVPIPWNDNTLETMLLTAEARNRVVVLGGSDGYWRKATVPGIVHRHCYAILAYEADTRHARLRDPMGADDRIPDRKKPGYGPGEFWLTLDEVEASFCGLAIEKR
jgi:hypothetical protein